METKTETIETVKHRGKYTFTDADRRKLADGLAEKCAHLQSLEDEKKSVMSDFKAKMDGTKASINEFTNKIQSGYEYRDFDCRVEKDYEDRTITFINIDTDKIVEARRMEDYEMQLEIGDQQKEEEPAT